jgi:5-methylthioadenosine/S-adenosylhomocysteine deaminase
VEWLRDIGFLEDRVLAAHCAWLTINEVRALARAGASVATCPVSNMKLATGGIAPIPELLREGANVSIGTDGSSTNNSLDMFGEMKTLALLQKSSRWDATVVSAQQALDFATLGGARAIGMSSDLSSIEPGKRADIVILDPMAANLCPVTLQNAVSSVVYSANAGNVRTVLCDGRVIVKDRRSTLVDEDEVVGSASAAASELLARN